MTKRIKPFFAIAGMLLAVSCSNENAIEMDILSNNATQNLSTRISIAEARADLESLLIDIDNPLTRSGATRRQIANEFSIPICHKNTRSEGKEETADTIPIYIFNFENDEGYAIMSGDSQIPSLIALAENGNITEEEEIDDPGLADFLEGMNNQIGNIYKPQQELQQLQTVSSFADENGDGNCYPAYGAWENIVYYPNGLCSVKWGQDSPYNKYCPIQNDKLTLTGCVPTSVAQLMSIYKHPDSYSGFSFAWDEMTRYKYAFGCSYRGQDDIARLMQLLGLKSNLDVSYGQKASGAKVENTIRTLSAFGYSSSGSMNDYSTSTVVSELKNGYGVLINGYSQKKNTYFLGIKVKTTYSGGHQWLAYGLLERRREVIYYNAAGIEISKHTESIWYPLCNWGWDGYHNGYYLSNAFDASSEPTFDDSTTSTRSDGAYEEGQDYNYQYKIKAITGIRK